MFKQTNLKLYFYLSDFKKFYNVISGKIIPYFSTFHVENIIVMLVCVMVLVACERNSQTWEQMDIAEKLMNEKPDSSLVILENIPTSDIKGKETSARYALLKSMALDKNYIDTTTFDILQPAIDYYIQNGTPDEKLTTYYYQGRIYQNQGDDDSAMQSFMNGCDLKQSVTDSLLLAHTLVAQGTLYLKQYKTTEYIHNNMAAAKLYGAVGKNLLEIKSYTNAIDGYIMLNNKIAADSLLSICIPLAQKNPNGEEYMFSSLLSYTIEFGSPHDIKAFLGEHQDIDLTKDEIMDFAQGYSKIGEYDKAIKCLAEISPDASTLDSLKYSSVKIDILEKQGKSKEALSLYKDYSVMLERYQKRLFSQDLLFADEKHQLEIKRLVDIQERNKIIWGTLCCILGLGILAGWLCYRVHLSRVKRILTEKENANLRLEQDNLCKEKKRLEAEQRQHELENANLKLEIMQLENERDNLKDLQREQLELAKPIQDVIKNRIDILNGLLAKEITKNDSYAKPYHKWIETVHNDKKKFMGSTRLAFAALYPKFIEYLEQHGLSTDDINYLCLYAIGLRGKEVGEYIQIKRHYIISHEIRMKLGIDEHETNIGPYIRKLIKNLGQTPKKDM